MIEKILYILALVGAVVFIGVMWLLLKGGYGE